MRKIDLIVIHCSNSEIPAHDNIETIRSWHLERGFNEIGYHFVIVGDGGTHIGRDIRLMGAHCYGYNRHSVGICLTGRFRFSQKQFDSLRKNVSNLRDIFGIKKKAVKGHWELNKNKTCPNFNIANII